MLGNDQVQQRAQANQDIICILQTGYTQTWSRTEHKLNPLTKTATESLTGLIISYKCKRTEHII